MRLMWIILLLFNCQDINNAMSSRLLQERLHCSREIPDTTVDYIRSISKTRRDAYTLLQWYASDCAAIRIEPIIGDR